jgi:Protein of unknown function (DUF3768)
MSTPYEDELDAKAARVRELNDEFRRHPSLLGVQIGLDKLVITRGVAARGDGFVDRAMRAVRDYADFTENNDPFGEHDLGTFTLDGAELMWKIDYYDNDLQYGSPNPADPDVTRRVLTVLLADEH